MTKYRLYAFITARLIIILLGYAICVPMFAFQILGTIGELFFTAFFQFLTTTKALVTKIEQQK